MQSLYNIAGFLGAQSRSNPSDHGDSWHSHKAAKLQSPNQDTSSPAFIEQPHQECLEIVAEQPKLTPINHLTINIGDVVRLVGDRSASEYWGCYLIIGNNYKVIGVDHNDKDMPIYVTDNKSCSIWVYAEDFVLVSTKEPKLIPINLNTIKVGDIVRLIGNRSVNALWGRDLTIGNSYEVVAVDRRHTSMPIQIRDNAHDDIWVYADDFRQVT